MVRIPKTYNRSLEFFSRHYLDRTLALKDYILRISRKQGKATPANTQIIVKGGVKTKISRLLEESRESDQPVKVSALLELIESNIIKSNWKDEWVKLELFNNRTRKTVPGNTHLNTLNGYSELAVPFNKNDRQEIIDYMEALSENKFDDVMTCAEFDISMDTGVNEINHENMIRAIFQSFVKYHGITKKEDKDRLITGLLQHNA